MGWWEAWTRWAAGDPTLKDAVLWGVKVLWWARIGKLMAFLAGLVLVVDIIGPERIVASVERRVAGGHLDRWRVDRRAARRGVIVFGGLFVLVLVGVVLRLDSGPLGILAIALVASVPALAAVNHLLPRFLTWLYLHDRVVTAIRTASLAAFVVGFHFDMLGS
ncbi:hypothetical protein GCM10022243_02030 [Saccharothrix violaceirubra]|uniref:Uncharacterized protein n=1 Tax=Saccharothrix violaceirubra TaxID=413306 RepID=A0A7W7T3L0_9PSEU|nr:hypothetical protein [Saccharothrix violaceirubra]MBB4965962.1 hypothetical protein [Saccharothrix violaceirubra]